MNSSSHIRIGNTSVSVLNGLHRDRTSLVSQLPLDVVGLIEARLLSESFTKISPLCLRRFSIGFIGDIGTESPASQQAENITICMPRCICLNLQSDFRVKTDR